MPRKVILANFGSQIAEYSTEKASKQQPEEDCIQGEIFCFEIMYGN
jgi:hypothetical protein